MGLFSKNKFNSNGEKLRLVNRIEQMQSRLSTCGLPKVVRALDGIVDILDDKYLSLHKEQTVLADTFLSDMDSRLKRGYEQLLLKKCEHLAELFKGECALDEHSLARIKNEDRVFEMIDEMAAIDAQIKSIDAKMDEALGKDKNTWTLLNAKRQALSGRMTVINKNYRTLLESQKALTLASEVRRAKEDAKEAMRQIGEREVIEFEENAEITTIATEDVNESISQMYESFGKAFGSGVGDAEYEKALEQKLAQQDVAQGRKRSSPAADGER